MFRILLYLFISFLSVSLLASHIKAGEILVTKSPSSSLRYTFDFVIYYDEGNITTDCNNPGSQIPICEINVNVGDGSSDQRVALTSLINYPDQGISKGIYRLTYTYPGISKYVITFSESFRISDILNMSNSANTDLFIDSEININPLQGSNTSPILTFPPIDIANQNRIYVHNPGAYDPDGDSLVFELIPPKQNSNLDVSNYASPANGAFGGVNTNGGGATISIDSKTGQIIWNTPGKPGYYNIAIRITEYRRGTKLGYVVRDMQIQVINDNNRPPVVVSLDSVCIEAQYLSQINFTVSDPNTNNALLIEGFGSAFQTVNPPSFVNLNNPVNNPYSGSLQWTPTCSLVREQPYQILVKASDNVAPSIRLADVKTILAKVRAPRPIWNSITKVNTNQVRLAWKPYNFYCVKNGIKLRIYRSECDSVLIFDPCKIQKFVSSNYKQIAELNYTDTTFTDTNFGQGLKSGVNYFYTIIAFFPESAKGVSYAAAIRKVSFNNASALINAVNVQNQSTIELEWSYPDLTGTTPNYGFWIQRSTDSVNYVTVYSQKDLPSLSQTNYTDAGLDIARNDYYYRIVHYVNNDSTLKYTSAVASNLKLTYTPLIASVKLMWGGAIPFNLTKIKLLDVKTNSIIDSTTSQNFFLIKNLKTCDTTEYAILTEQSYCSGSNTATYDQKSYKIRVTPLVDPNVNFATKIRYNYCDFSSCSTEIPLPVSDTLTWPDLTKSICSGVVGYNVYFKSVLETSFKKIATTTDTFYVSNNSITRVGCYYVTLITLNNLNQPIESNPSSEVCVNNDCYCYTLPNVITPNNDGLNDVLYPLKYPRFLKSFYINIYNRWGVKVFETADININWDAKNVDSGVYFYEVSIKKYSLDGHESDFIKGYVSVLK